VNAPRRIGKPLSVEWSDRCFFFGWTKSSPNHCSDNPPRCSKSMRHSAPSVPWDLADFFLDLSRRLSQRCSCVVPPLAPLLFNEYRLFLDFSFQADVFPPVAVHLFLDRLHMYAQLLNDSKLEDSPRRVSAPRDSAIVEFLLREFTPP